MSQRLVIYLEPDSAVLIGHRPIGQPGRAVVRRAGDPDAAAAMLPDAVDQVTLVVPGEAVLVRTARLPARATAKAMAALPYVLEDDLADEERPQHFAMGGPAAGGDERLVAAVAREQMDQWLAAARSIGVEPDRVVPDHAALAPELGLTIIDRGARVIIAPAARPGVAVDREIAGPVLADLVGGEDEPVTVLGDAAEALAPADGWRERPVTHAPALTDQALIDRLLAADAPALDLLQGPYAKRKPWLDALPRWRAAAALALLIGAVHVASLGYEGWALNARTDALHTRAEAVFRQTFPDTRRVVNPRAQMAAKLRDMEGVTSDTFLALTAVLFDALTGLDGVEIETLRFDQARDQLTVGLSYPAFTAIEQVKAALAERGARFDEGGARQVDGRIVGDGVVRTP